MSRQGILRIVIKNAIKSHKDNSKLAFCLQVAKFLPADSKRRMDSIFEEMGQ